MASLVQRHRVLPPAMLVLLVAMGCSRGTKKPAEPLKPATTEAPYTVEQLKAALRPGTTYEFSVRTPGKQEQRRIMTFLNPTDKDVLIHGVTLDARGGAVEPPKDSRATWDELRSHGVFPLAATQVINERVSLPVGFTECNHYIVKEGTGDDAKVEHFLFAKSMPGPPVLFYTEQGKNRLMTTMLMKFKSGG